MTLQSWHDAIEVLTFLPKLAWAIRVRRGRLIEGQAGSWVEVGDSFIYEGVWNEDGVGSAFEESASFFGSGARVSTGGVVVASPCHTTEAVYSIRTADEDWIVSNYLPLALASAEAELDDDFFSYECAARSISGGIHDYMDQWPLADDRILHVDFYRNILFSSRGEVLRQPKVPTPEFSSFGDYRSFLSTETAGIMRSARRPSRKRKFEPIAFCSNGYDSTAVSVLAREQGGNLAVAFESKYRGRSDSGADIARCLGFNTVLEKFERDYLSGSRSHRFFGTGELGTSIFFLAAEEELKGRILFSGAHGDKMWSADFIDDREVILRSAYPDTARTNFRLDVGYINYAPAFLTATSQRAMHALSNSDPLAEWSLGNDYDRPVPRRIAEDAGVPRTAFGMHKQGGAGTSLGFGGKRRVMSLLPNADRSNFADFLANRGPRAMRPKSVLQAAAYSVYFAGVGARVLGVGWPAKVLRLDSWPCTLKSSPFAPSRLFQWAIRESQRELSGD